MSHEAQRVINFIYQDGEVDIMLFGYMIGFVSADIDDNSYQKTDAKRLEDAIALTKYLAHTGDFEVGLTEMGENGNFTECAFADFSSFVDLVSSVFAVGGIDDIDLLTQTWLRKVRKGSLPPDCPAEIAQLFSSTDQFTGAAGCRPSEL